MSRSAVFCWLMFGLEPKTLETNEEVFMLNQKPFYSRLSDPQDGPEFNNVEMFCFTVSSVLITDTLCVPLKTLISEPLTLSVITNSSSTWLNQTMMGNLSVDACCFFVIDFMNDCIEQII